MCSVYLGRIIIARKDMVLSGSRNAIALYEKLGFTEEGVYLRMCRSIQIEGSFGLLKTDFGFRRFLTTGKKNVKTELLFLALGFNLKKNWMKAQAKREKTHLSVIKKTA